MFQGMTWFRDLDWWGSFDGWSHSCCGGEVCFILDFHVKECAGCWLGMMEIGLELSKLKIILLKIQTKLD